MTTVRSLGCNEIIDTYTITIVCVSDSHSMFKERTPFRFQGEIWYAEVQSFPFTLNIDQERLRAIPFRKKYTGLWSCSDFKTSTGCGLEAKACLFASHPAHGYSNPLVSISATYTWVDNMRLQPQIASKGLLLCGSLLFGVLFCYYGVCLEILRSKACENEHVECQFIHFVWYQKRHKSEKGSGTERTINPGIQSNQLSERNVVLSLAYPSC